MANIKAGIVLSAVLFFSTLAGCSSMNDSASTGLYQTVVSAKGGGGEIYLASSAENIPELRRGTTHRMRLTALGIKPKVRFKGGKPEERTITTGKWIVLSEKNEKGDEIGITISPYDSGEVLRDAFSQELSAAGYKVKLVRVLPNNVARGIDLSRITIDAEQNTGLLETEGDCNVNIRLDLWKHGSRVKSFNYEGLYSDSAIYDRDGLLETLIQGSLQNLMKQAVPDIIREMGDQS
jgi:hypothetical protein